MTTLVRSRIRLFESSPAREHQPDEGRINLAGSSGSDPESSNNVHEAK